MICILIAERSEYRGNHINVVELYATFYNTKTKTCDFQFVTIPYHILPDNSMLLYYYRGYFTPLNDCL